ncbi:MAG: hypothetical protein ACOCX4_10595 [Planctomycetota bacterium]
MTEWKVGRGARCCAATGRAFAPGEEYFSALVEAADGFQRLDYAVEAWAGQETGRFFSFWKTRMPREEEEADARRIVDTEVIYRFFRKLADTDTVEKQTFRYLLALILVRKRFLRLTDFVRRDGREYLLAWDRRAEEALEVLNPEATRETLAAAQRELGCIFDMDFEEGEGEAGPVPEEAAAES